jgi:hypothetical protein
MAGKKMQDGRAKKRKMAEQINVRWSSKSKKKCKARKAVGQKLNKNARWSAKKCKTVEQKKCKMGEQKNVRWSSRS